MARASLFGIPPTVVYNHPNNSDASSLYLDGNPEPLRCQPTPEVRQSQLPQNDVGPRLRRKTAIRGSLRMSDDSVGQQNLMLCSMKEPQPLFELSDISLSRQITSRSSGSVSSAPRIGAELTRVSCDPIPQAGRLIHERRRRSAGIFHQLKRCFRPPCQDSSSSTEESAPARFRVISNECSRPRSIGWPSRLELANRPTEYAHENVPPPMLDAIPNFSSDIADWLSGLPDLTSDDSLGGQSENMLKIAAPASGSGMRSRQKEQVEIVQSEEENATDFFCY